MKDGLKDRILNYLTWGALAVIFIGGLLLAYPDFCRSKSLMRTNAELQEQIDRKKQEIADLVENQRRFRTDADFVEMLSRQNHRVFPGELIFIFNKN